MITRALNLALVALSGALLGSALTLFLAVPKVAQAVDTHKPVRIVYVTRKAPQ